MAKNEPVKAESPTLPIPALGEKVFAVCYPKDTAAVHVCAINDREAWAKFCDGTKQWPSPKLATVNEVK